jgi:hypothetical protein
MRIRELLENHHFSDKEFVNPTETGREINYDLIQDLMYFMNHDDEVYRRHVYPSIAECLDQFTANRPTKSSMFKPAVDKSYQQYIKKYPIRELPQQLDEKTAKEVCDKMHEEVRKHLTDGKYKD